MFPHVITHALDWFCLAGRGYQFWSGIGSDFSEVTLIAGIYVLIRRHNCHVKGCKSVLTHPDPEHNWPACRRHHSMGHKLG